MCITVEKTHLKLLAKKLNGVVAELRREAPTRATEFLLSVDPGYAEATIIFRDFPKRHGNIISAAVKLALDGHVGGLSQSEKNFTFLSGAKVAVDNFFLSSTGRIYLFETRRDFSKVRLDAQKSAAEKLFSVAKHLQDMVPKKTGRRLRHPIQCVFFSYVDALSPCAPAKLNIGSTTTPQNVQIPVYGRKEMNDLIGPCFGQFIEDIDDLVGRNIGQLVKGISLRPDKQRRANPLVDTEDQPSGEYIQVGDEECSLATESEVLE